MFLLCNFNSPLFLLENEITCSTWPTSETFSCRDGGDYKTLDWNLDSSQTSACELLCIDQGEKGCCSLQTGYGCSWKPGGRVVPNYAGLAVSCSSAGMLSQNFSY